MNRVWLLCALLATVLWACKEQQEPHEHANEHLAGHDHHPEGHGHDEPVARITKWGPEFEVFAEHEAAVVGHEVSVLAHLTILDGFAPLEAGTVSLELSGPAAIKASSAKPLRPGIYQLRFTPKTPGKYSGSISVKGPTSGSIQGVEVEVFDSGQKAHEAMASEEHHGLIELLKEQQWGVPFGTAFAEQGSFVATIQVAGTVETPPGGSAQVGAPVAGRVIAPARGLPRPGDSVKKGQLLASLAPAPASPEAAARATLTVAEAKARAGAAQAALKRAERLIQDEAISQRELEDAQREVDVADEAVRAAQQAAALFSGAQSGGGAGAWRLVAPIDGIVTSIEATPGASVSPGDVLFRLLDGRELWLRARVPEQDASRLRADHDAAYQVAGLDTWNPIAVTGEDAPASVVTVGRTVDPKSRTVDIIYGLHEPDPNLRVGGLIQLSLPTGEDFSGLVVPRTAILSDQGRDQLYVQVDGEHFEERVVKVGARSGQRVGILSGLKKGERIVVRGAHLVRLADRASSSQPHGHIH